MSGVLFVLGNIAPFFKLGLQITFLFESLKVNVTTY